MAITIKGANMSKSDIKVPITTGTVIVSTKKPKELLMYAKSLKKTADGIEKQTKTKTATLQKSIAAMQAKITKIEQQEGKRVRDLRADEKRVMKAFQQTRAK